MSGIRSPVIKNHLGIAGQFDPPGPVTGVAKREPPQLQISVWSDADLQLGFNPLIQPVKFSNAAVKPALLVRRWPLAKRPEHAVIEIAQIQQETAAAFQRIRRPAGQSQLVPY